jgi:hypothetical protein
MKKTRVKEIKNNITTGTKIPVFQKDGDAGIYIDQLMVNKGHAVDKNGLVDMPEYGVDNKSRKKGSHAHHTVGSMTIDNIISTPDFKNTRYYHKVQNQNQVTYDSDFLEVCDVVLLDMDIELIQEKLAEGYNDCREQLINGVRDKEIKSKNKWVVFDGYVHHNSYRMRITNSAMKKIHNISGVRDTYKNLFEEVQ